MTLIEAIEASDIAEARRLLEGGADPNLRAEWGDPALFVAVEQGDLSMVSLLLGHGADATARDAVGASVLHARPRHPELMLTLLRAGAPVNARDEEGVTALYLSVDDPVLVKMLLDHGADPNLATNNHETPLSFCAAWGYEASAEILLEGGANPRFVDEESGWVVLFCAAAEGHTRLVELLLNHGADPDYVSSSGQCALGVALKRERLDTALLLSEWSHARTRALISAERATLHDKLQRLMRSLNRE
jgi:ankyrin repeat protein